ESCPWACWQPDQLAWSSRSRPVWPVRPLSPSQACTSCRQKISRWHRHPTLFSTQKPPDLGSDSHHDLLQAPTGYTPISLTWPVTVLPAHRCCSPARWTEPCVRRRSSPWHL